MMSHYVNVFVITAVTHVGNYLLTCKSRVYMCEIKFFHSDRLLYFVHVSVSEIKLKQF